MSVVDVDKMIKDKEQSEKASEFKEQAQDKKLKKRLDPKNQKIEFGKPAKVERPNPVFEREQVQQLISRLRENEEGEKEMKTGVKNGIFYVASLPIKKERQKALRERLENSRFLNRYVDENLYVDYLRDCDENLKALACYGYHYFNALKDDI